MRMTNSTAASQLPEHSCLVFHDSEISNIARDDQTVVIVFSAAFIHVESAHAGFNTPTGYLQSVQLVCLGVESMQADASCFGRLSGGEVLVNGQRMSSVPVPYDTSAACMLELEFTNGSRVTLNATGLQLRLTDTSRFTESFSC